MLQTLNAERVFYVEDMQKLKYKGVEIPYLSVNGKNVFQVKVINIDILGNTNSSYAFDSVKENHIVKLKTKTKGKRTVTHPMYVDLEGLIIKLNDSYKYGKNQHAKEFLDFLEEKITNGDISHHA